MLVDLNTSKHAPMLVPGAQVPNYNTQCSVGTGLPQVLCQAGGPIWTTLLHNVQQAMKLIACGMPGMPWQH